MKKTILIIALFTALTLHAEKPSDVLKDMHNQIIENEVKDSANKPQSIRVPEHNDQKVSDNRIRITISKKDCLDQGNTLAECELLVKSDESELNPYSVNRPKLPTLDEAKDDVFINIQIKTN